MNHIMSKRVFYMILFDAFWWRLVLTCSVQISKTEYHFKNSLMIRDSVLAIRKVT